MLSVTAGGSAGGGSTRSNNSSWSFGLGARLSCGWAGALGPPVPPADPLRRPTAGCSPARDIPVSLRLQAIVLEVNVSDDVIANGTPTVILAAAVRSASTDPVPPGGAPDAVLAHVLIPPPATTPHGRSDFDVGNVRDAVGFRVPLDPPIRAWGWSTGAGCSTCLCTGSATDRSGR